MSKLSVAFFIILTSLIILSVIKVKINHNRENKILVGEQKVDQPILEKTDKPVSKENVYVIPNTKIYRFRNDKMIPGDNVYNKDYKHGTILSIIEYDDQNYFVIKLDDKNSEELNESGIFHEVDVIVLDSNYKPQKGIAIAGFQIYGILHGKVIYIGKSITEYLWEVEVLKKIKYENENYLLIKFIKTGELAIILEKGFVLND